jgi:rhomboid protease GluP
VIAMAATGILTWFALKKIPNHVGKYDAYMQVLYQNDTTALSVYQLPDSLPKQDKLNFIHQTSVQRCTQSLKMIAELEHTDLPPHLKYRLQLFKKYFQLRLKSYENYYQVIEHDSETADSILGDLYSQIDSINKIIEQHD